MRKNSKGILCIMDIIVEIIISGFVSKAISNCFDISWIKIKRAVRNRKSYHQNLESQIYNITVDTLNKITYNRYEANQNKIYYATEILLKLFKENKNDNLRNIKSCLNTLYSYVSEDFCIDFMTQLYQELGKNKYSELYRAILLLQLEQKHQYDNSIYKQLNEKLDEIEKIINLINIKSDNSEKYKTETFTQNNVLKYQNNKKKDYIKNWNNRMFLHLNNNKNPITLADAFIVPDYKMYKDIKRAHFSDKDPLDRVIEKFTEYNITSTMLIIGVPGIGKSSIVSWIADNYSMDDRFIILRFRDWEEKELKEGLLHAICNTLCCMIHDLQDKILILDGFDEIKSLDKAGYLLSKFIGDKKDLKNFKCIITSRSSYINDLSYFDAVIKLKEFTIEKVDNFFWTITGNTLDDKQKIESNLEVLGIPVILYMAIMSNIDICQNPTKPELYNHIFAINGGIFDRFYDEGIEYESGSQILRNPDNTKEYLNFLSDIAFKMFETGTLSLQKGDYEIPKLEFQGKNISVLEFPIKHLFENIESKIEFIHKSIFEYFISDYIFMKIREVINNKEEEIAGILGKLFKPQILSSEILEFLKYKITKLGQNYYYDIINKSFQIMLQYGMTYYTGHMSNVIKHEMIVFFNMMEFIHLWDQEQYKLNPSITEFLKCNRKENLNLSKVDLAGLDLTIANLVKANLKGANLERANLTGANLRDANLEGANLNGITVKTLTLTGAVLNDYQVEYLEKKCNLIGIKIYNRNTDKIVTYDEYCKKGKKKI